MMAIFFFSPSETMNNLQIHFFDRFDCLLKQFIFYWSQPHNIRCFYVFPHKQMCTTCVLFDLYFQYIFLERFYMIIGNNLHVTTWSTVLVSSQRSCYIQTQQLHHSINLFLRIYHVSEIPTHVLTSNRSLQLWLNKFFSRIST